VHEPVTAIVLALAVLLVAAKLGGELATRAKQPAVLGELLAGVVIGNLHHLGFTRALWMRDSASIDLLAQLGVLLLLFEVGLESTVKQMLAVGWPSLRVAVIGVVLPASLGVIVAQLVLPGRATSVHAFVGATLAATSVGITARVLKDIGRSRTAEARVILGAAVIDDVLGLVLLAFVTALARAAEGGAAPSASEIALLVAKCIGFLVLSTWAGLLLSPRMFHIASRLHTRGVLLALGLAFCFAFAALASAIGLAPIVGAFAAGLVLEQLHYKDFTTRGEQGLEVLVRPISAFLAPIFFVTMGMRTDVATLVDKKAPLLAALLVVVAIVGKLAAGLGARKGMSRLAIGVGMIPRGEVGLIFAAEGQRLLVGGVPVIDRPTFAAVVVMVLVTTMVAPPWLARVMKKLAPDASDEEPRQTSGKTS
jgi:Kef-type K+ transport system membrane component KefB